MYPLIEIFEEHSLGAMEEGGIRVKLLSVLVCREGCLVLLGALSWQHAVFVTFVHFRSVLEFA